jgi:pyridoxal phosphate enzyme (YggS family)
MSHAAMRAGRAPDSARLVAVSKTVGLGPIGDAVDAGLRVFGESKVQEAREKIEALAGRGLEWHLIGHLQRNKAKAAVGLFDLIHSVDSVGLLEAVDRHARDLGKVQRVLLQVKLSHEESKHGASERELQGMAEAARGLSNVQVEGLMTIPPFFDDAEGARPFFRRLRELNGPYGFPELSMGMTGDFEVAIEEGATLVRIGTAIFGERNYR